MNLHSVLPWLIRPERNSWIGGLEPLVRVEMNERLLARELYICICQYSLRVNVQSLSIEEMNFQHVAYITPVLLLFSRPERLALLYFSSIVV